MIPSVWCLLTCNWSWRWLLGHWCYTLDGSVVSIIIKLSPTVKEWWHLSFVTNHENDQCNDENTIGGSQAEELMIVLSYLVRHTGSPGQYTGSYTSSLILSVSLLTKSYFVGAIIADSQHIFQAFNFICSDQNSIFQKSASMFGKSWI